MPLQRFPVTVPYLLDDAQEPALFEATVAAENPGQAAAIAQILAAAGVRMRHPASRARIPPERIAAGAPAGAVEGVYGYVLTSRLRADFIAFPTPLDDAAAPRITELMAGIETRNLYGVIADVSAAPSPSVACIAALTRAGDSHCLRLVRVGQGLTETLVRAGLQNRLRSFPDLQRAIADLVTSYLQLAATIQR